MLPIIFTSGFILLCGIRLNDIVERVSTSFMLNVVLLHVTRPSVVQVNFNYLHGNVHNVILVCVIWLSVCCMYFFQMLFC